MRNAFADELVKLAREDERIVMLSGDMGNNLFNNFKKEFPERFINCGAAEANMTGMAAGLAMAGFLPVTYSIAAFNPGRCAEQIRLDICLQNLHVVIVGVGAGFSYASLGPTHHSLEDIAWMRPLPNMAILCPADAMETRGALRAAARHDSPVYLRLGKKNEPAVHDSVPDFRIGKSIVLREGNDVCLLSVGALAPLALQTAEILGEKGISAQVASIGTVKPLDSDFLNGLFASGKIVAVLEEQYAAGGTWSALAEWLALRGMSGKLLRFGPGDKFYTSGGDTAWARQCAGLTPQDISSSIMSELAKGGN